MKTGNFTIILFALLFLSSCCREKESIIGTWSFCLDGIYHELYINESLIAECTHGIMAVSPSNQYILNNDTIFIYRDENIVNHIPIPIIEKNKIVIFYDDNWVVCDRVSEVESIYYQETFVNRKELNRFIFRFKLRAQKTDCEGSPF